MFYQFQSGSAQQNYKQSLLTIAQLSNLFSTSSVPYVNYRVHENFFCKAFGARDLSRSDVAFDAQIGNKGFGLKTFICLKESSLEKVAEFNAKAPELNGITDPKKVVEKVGQWRNERIDFSLNAYGISESIYHCLVRREGRLIIYEEPMKKITTITDVVDKGNSITFKSNGEEYSFLRSKNTLTKKFYIKEERIFDIIQVNIIKNPLDFLLQSQAKLQFREHEETQYDVTVKTELDSVYLPFYSTSKAKGKFVPEKSQLNQWNAGGRIRHADEMYIKIPSWIHKVKPDFFPPKDVPFDLELTDGKTVKAKVCQDGGKALMTNPNKELGEWIRNTLGLKEKQLLTIDMLEVIDIDSVVVYKVAENKYCIDFAKTNSYEEFKENLNK